MNWNLIIPTFFIYNVVGFIALIVFGICYNPIGKCRNSDFFMPTYIYKHCRVNYFGTLMLCLFVNALCPVWSFGFWFYKLCTVGRKELDYER